MAIAYVKAGATTASVSMYVFWTHACVLIPKTRFPSNHVSETLHPKTERILQVRACRNFRGSFEHRNCAIVHVHLELRLQHWKIFGYVTTPYPTAYVCMYVHWLYINTWIEAQAYTHRISIYTYTLYIYTYIYIYIIIINMMIKPQKSV